MCRPATLPKMINIDINMYISSGDGSNGCVCIYFLLDQYIGLFLYWEANILVLFIPYDYYKWVFKSISELFDDQFIILDFRKIKYVGFHFGRSCVLLTLAVLNFGNDLVCYFVRSAPVRISVCPRALLFSVFDTYIDLIVYGCIVAQFIIPVNVSFL